MSRVTEMEIGLATLRVLQARPAGEASLADLKREIPHMINLSPEDQARSVTRPKEEMWEQQVRNLISHRTAEGNIFAEGYAVYVEGQPLRITEAGKTHLRNKGH